MLIRACNKDELQHAPVAWAARQGVDGARERSVYRLVDEAHRRRAAVGECVPEKIGVLVLAINGEIAHLDTSQRLIATAHSVYNTLLIMYTCHPCSPHVQNQSNAN